jgi:two-component system, NarL family, response regulator LiaR
MITYPIGGGSDNEFDGWLTTQYTGLVEDLSVTLDVPSGVAEATQETHFTDLTADLSEALDLDAGLLAILDKVAAPDAAGSGPPPDGETEPPTSGQFPGQGRVPSTTRQATGSTATAVRPTVALSDPAVLIIDDHDLVVASLALSLRSAGLQAERRTVRSREDVFAATATLSPGIVLLDLDLGRSPNGTPIDGTTFIEPFCAAGWRVLVLSTASDEARIGKALAAGALAGIPKSTALPVLVTAVQRAAQGVEVMHPERRRQLIEAHRQRQNQVRMIGQRLARLSERERAVLELLARGRRAQSIAEEFNVSLATTRTQIRAVLHKLEVTGQLEAVALLNDYRREQEDGQ